MVGPGTAMGIKWAIKWDVQLYNQQYMDFMDSIPYTEYIDPGDWGLPPFKEK